MVALVGGVAVSHERGTPAARGCLRTRERGQDCQDSEVAGVWVQWYLAEKKQRPPKDPPVGLCPGPYGGDAGRLDGAAGAC
jgi:hypothetical protein